MTRATRAMWLVAAATALAATAIGCSSGANQGTATAAATTTATPVLSASIAAGGGGAQAAAPTPAAELPGLLLRPGPPIPLPMGVVLYVADAAYEGPTGAIRRYYRSPDGVFHEDVLLESHFGFGAEYADSRTISSRAASPDGQEIGATLCHGVCYGSPEPVTLVHSADGGVTWTAIGELEAGGWTLGVGGGRALVEQGVNSDPTFLIFPGGTPAPAIAVEPGSERNFSMAFGVDGAKFIVLTGGKDRRTWTVADGAHTPFATLPIPSNFEVFSVELLPRRSGQGIDLVAMWGNPGADSSNFGIFDRATGGWSHILRTSRATGLDSVQFTGWLDGRTLIGRGSFSRSLFDAAPPDWFSGLPALIDVTTGVVSPIAEFTSFAGAKAGGPAPIAAATGAFVAVRGAGDCLNVRAGPALSSEVLGCYVDRVLLRREAGREESGSVTWQQVQTPDGRIGWASAAFLELATE